MSADEPTADARELTRVSISEESDGRSPMLEIANAMVRIYKEAFGRGPTKARAQFAGADALVVILEQTLTVAERNLLAMGEIDQLRDARQLFQSAFEPEFRAIVEQALDRRTTAFVSGLDPQRDVAVELFTLEQRSPAALQAVASRPDGLSRVPADE